MGISAALLNDWYPVARGDAVGEGQLCTVRLLGEDLVLWRAGIQAVAWQDLCVHRGTRLSLGKVENGLLVCPYHGWRYDSHGRCAHIPAHPEQTPPEKAAARVYQIKERYGLVWVSLGQPDRDVPPFPEQGDPAYRTVLCGPSDVLNASAPRIIENFLDVAHLPHVHGGILGDPRYPEMPEYRTETGTEGISARNISVYQPNPYGSGSGEQVIYTYHVLRPFMAYLVKDAEGGVRFTLAAFLTPHDELHTTAWFYMAVSAGVDTPDADMIAYQNAIFAQDRPIVESQRPKLLPLDLQDELHLRSDRTGLTYRKWLHEQGVNYGTT